MLHPGSRKPQAPPTSSGRSSGRSSEPPIFLHIGAMKTGTTYLQRLMETNRHALAEAGYLFPGEAWTDHGRATRDVMAPSADDDSPPPVGAGAWQRLAGEMLAHQGAGSVLSHEFLSFATAAQARRIVESFGDREVRVILTVRDAARLIPAQWQTRCRNGGTVSFAAFVDGIQSALEGSPGAGRPARIFERTQGVPRMLDAWVPLVGADRVHVVTVPPRGAPPDLLWHRFASVLGVDPEVCAAASDYVNLSLGFASSELLRRVNRQLGHFERPLYQLVVKGALARHVLGARAHLERPIRLHRGGLETAACWNRRMRSAIEAAGVEVVGSLQDLPTDGPGAAAPAKLDRPRRQELVEAATTARDGLVELYNTLSERQLPTEPPHQRTGPAGPADVRSAVREVTGLVRDCLDLAAEAPAAYDSLRRRF